MNKYMNGGEQQLKENGSMKYHHHQNIAAKYICSAMTNTPTVKTL